MSSAALERAEMILLDDGASAEKIDGGLELRDVEGRLLVRYRDGQAEIAAPAGDLVLSAPEGAVRIDSATDVTIEAGRDLKQVARRRAEVAVGDRSRLALGPREAALEAPQVEVTAGHVRLATGTGQLIATHVRATAETVVQRVERYELEAGRIVERSKEALRQVEGLLETKAGRMRSAVRGLFALKTHRTTMVSEEETAIDGDKVLLG